MRREGFEFQVSRPHVINKIVDEKTLTPFELVEIETPDEYSGAVMEKMGIRHAKLTNMHSHEGVTHLEFTIATKELIGYRSEFITDTKGLGIINTSFYDFLPDDGYQRTRDWGSLVAHETGETKLYGLVNIQDRGQLFYGPAEKVYKGQVVGRNSREEDIRVNVCKEKQLSNMRSKGEGTSEHFNTPKIMSLEESLEYIDDSELVEVTPKSVRIRKVILDELEEKRMKRGLKG